MRLLCTIPSERKEENPFAFSYFLAGHGVENECEELETAQGVVYRIWIEEEDQVSKAQELYKEYQADPNHPRYHERYSDVHEESIEEEKPKPPPIRPRPSTPFGKVSLIILIAVVGLFFWGLTQRTMLVPPTIPGVITAPVLPKIDRGLLFDFPQYFQLRDELLKLYTKRDIEEKRPPSPEAISLLRKLRSTPVWMGFYPRLVAHLKNRDSPLSYTGPLFEKIGQGQIWRLFTPCLLHFNLIHIFFNVLWFLILTNQVESRVGSIRYLILLLTIGILSDVAQYLMSGPFFMGLSGIVCGLAGFIWARQQIAPWEGYLLPRITLIFLAIFVFGMFFLSVALFFVEIFGKLQLPFIIANTAHLTGGFTGYLLGRTKIFSIRHKTNFK